MSLINAYEILILAIENLVLHYNTSCKVIYLYNSRELKAQLRFLIKYCPSKQMSENTWAAFHMLIPPPPEDKNIVNKKN